MAWALSDPTSQRRGALFPVVLVACGSRCGPREVSSIAGLTIGAKRRMQKLMRCIALACVATVADAAFMGAPLRTPPLRTAAVPRMAAEPLASTAESTTSLEVRRLAVRPLFRCARVQRAWSHAQRRTEKLTVARVRPCRPNSRASRPRARSAAADRLDRPPPLLPLTRRFFLGGNRGRWLPRWHRPWRRWRRRSAKRASSA